MVKVLRIIPYNLS